MILCGEFIIFLVVYITSCKIIEEDRDFNRKKLALFIFFSSLIMSYLIYNINIPMYDKFRGMLFILFAVFISSVDIWTFYIYDIVSVVSTIFFIILNIPCGATDVSASISGAVFCGILSWAMKIVSNGIGDGDIGIFAMCGAFIGGYGSIIIIPESFMLASVIYVVVYILGYREKELAFSPFILGATFAKFIGSDIIEIYMETIKYIL